MDIQEWEDEVYLFLKNILIDVLSKEIHSARECELFINGLNVGLRAYIFKFDPEKQQQFSVSIIARVLTELAKDPIYKDLLPTEWNPLGGKYYSNSQYYS